MFFAFKQQVEDFIVSEILEQEPSGTGEYFWIFFEKKGKNTMEILESICKHFQLKREHLGICGLKDKQGITRQRLSIKQNKLKTCGWKSAFLDFLAQEVKILRQERHTEALQVWKNKGNSFQIRLRKRQTLPLDLKQELEKKLEIHKTSPFPNAFGIQRFWKGNKNFKKAQLIFSEEIKEIADYQVKFKLQSRGNMRFNELLMQRRYDQAWILDGDIMINGRNAFGSKVASFEGNKLHHFDYREEKKHVVGKTSWEQTQTLWSSDFNPEIWMPTGIVLGTEQLLCKQWTAARLYEDQILNESGFYSSGANISKHRKLYGFRRPLRCSTKDLTRNREEDWSLLLSFSLPTGAYASVFLAQILENIDPKWCIAGNLIIPRINQ